MLAKMKMNVKLWTLVLPCVFVLSQPAFADDKKPQDAPKEAAKDASKDAAKKQPTKEEMFSQDNINKLSETYGHLIQKGLDNPVLKLDFDSVIKGMQSGRQGKPAPMTEQEYEETINLLQEYAYQDLASRNLQEAVKFLAENKKKEGVKEVDSGKLQYLVVQEGKGEVVTEDMRPSIKYSGQYLDGTVFGSSDSSSGPISISLKQTIPGFRKGILGMKVGEKRRIFIHPELGYGTSGQLLPNALLIFDIEVMEVKPEPKEASKQDSDSDDGLDMDGDDKFSDDGQDDDLDDMDIAAENLYPDELDEQIERNDVETPEKDIQQNDFNVQPGQNDAEMRRQQRTREQVKAQTEREQALKKKEAEEQKQKAQQKAQQTNSPSAQKQPAKEEAKPVANKTGDNKPVAKK